MQFANLPGLLSHSLRNESNGLASDQEAFMCSTCFYKMQFMVKLNMQSRRRTVKISSVVTCVRTRIDYSSILGVRADQIIIDMMSINVPLQDTGFKPSN